MNRLLLTVACLAAASIASAAEAPIKVLFLGDQGHHRPAERFAQLQPVLTPRGIELVYTENLSDLDPAVLAAYDALAVYANIDTLPPAGEAAILDFVRNGKGSCRCIARVFVFAIRRPGSTSWARSFRSTALASSAR